MILKIEKIKSVGKFRDFQAVGDIAFRRLTLVYAENGSGKTTLTSIIRSLTENNVPLIVKRASVNNGTAQQEAQVIQRANAGDINHSFQAAGWTNHNGAPAIEVFDNHFVNENVFSGFTFSNDHGYSLHQFVIGSAGVSIRQRIEQNKGDKTAARQEIDGFRAQLIAQVGFGLDQTGIPDFLNITVADASDIDRRISVAQGSLSNALASQVIQSLPLLLSLSVTNPPLNLNDILQDLQTTVEQIQNDTLRQLFDNHCLELSENDLPESRSWLRQGFSYIRAKEQAEPHPINCPFCKQDVPDNLDIILAYTQAFNDAFNGFMNKLSASIRALESYNPNADIQSLNLMHAQNMSRVTSWQAYITVNAPELNLVPDPADIRQLRDNLVILIQQKISNPSIAHEETAIFAFREAFEALNAHILIYNESVIQYNIAIGAFRATIPGVLAAQSEFNRLSRIKKRIEVPIDTLCIQLRAEVVRLDSLTAAYPGLIEQQNNAASAFFAQYGTRVNYYLRDVFHTPFQIVNVQNIPPQGRSTQSRLGYSITIDDHPIEFDHSQPHNVRDSLSEGDKSSLALAFFLSKIDNDPGVSDKIVVLDDPLSSFDRKRRIKTLSILTRLTGSVKQLVVLSHEAKFLYDLNRRIRGVEKKGLMIELDGTLNSSVIREFNIEKGLQSDYFASIDKIKDFIAQGTDAGKSEIRKEIRTVLESYLIFKFYSAMNGNVNGTFGWFITQLQNRFNTTQITFRDSNGQQVIDDLNELNEMSWDSHHGDVDVFETVTEVPIEQISLPEIKAYLVKTMDLIENRL